MTFRIRLPLLFSICVTGIFAQEDHAAETLAISTEYRLPLLLESKSGSKVKTATDWNAKRRPEILKAFEEQVYGNAPSKDWKLSFKQVQETSIFNGEGILRQVDIEVSRKKRTATLQLSLFLPAQSKEVPVFLGLNFFGNHTVTDIEAIRVPSSWSPNSETIGVTDNRPNEAGRGKRAHRWPVQRILNHGYGLATLYAGDIDPDKDDPSDGVQSLFYGSGQTQADADEWGTIAAWAWGLSRAMDYLQQAPAVDHHRVIVMGHSRLGKASLWAGAQDQRFAMVISNNSGCGGAALSRRRHGETVADINQRFPHWFAKNFHAYNNREDALPVDQHQLIALAAPRPVYVASAVDDDWADPRGEYLSAFLASLVYQLFGDTGLTNPEMPKENALLHDSNVGYHIRSGKHDVTDFDWDAWIAFANQRL